VRAGLVTGAGWVGNRVTGGAGSVANGAGFGVPAGGGAVREAFAAAVARVRPWMFLQSSL
jgi:hypothetical protein